MLGLVLADVSRKGTAAALLMSATRGMLRSLADTCGSPAEVLSKLNCLMLEDFPSGRFVTLIFAVLDPANRTLRFASAGHLPPILIDADGARYLEDELGMPLGLSRGGFSDTEIELRPGAKLAFYSDGITEASGSNNEEYGVQRLSEHPSHRTHFSREHSCRRPQICEWTGLQDDATVILVCA